MGRFTFKRATCASTKGRWRSPFPASSPVPRICMKVTTKTVGCSACRCKCGTLSLDSSSGIGASSPVRIHRCQKLPHHRPSSQCGKRFANSGQCRGKCCRQGAVRRSASNVGTALRQIVDDALVHGYELVVAQAGRVKTPAIATLRAFVPSVPSMRSAKGSKSGVDGGIP
ncbi:hypothetical protein B879_04230 [Cecembia lonarensis LW9]|uniref:Uncharacterized protein n=1 Tax=Cecembia lonarensis (strain CCUG 58316 / KCTC 22772 / LW9) TaxID=1225176 RepID=K1L566_CECL9|nr:hypothetical protein B879_04230 [Cecembia lonarensis LW9]